MLLGAPGDVSNSLQIIAAWSSTFAFIILFKKIYPGLMLFTFLATLVKGPLGEELGWRGYALNELQKKYSPLKSFLIIGLLWGF